MKFYSWVLRISFMIVVFQYECLISFYKMRMYCLIQCFFIFMVSWNIVLHRFWIGNEITETSNKMRKEEKQLVYVSGKERQSHYKRKRMFYVIWIKLTGGKVDGMTSTAFWNQSTTNFLTIKIIMIPLRFSVPSKLYFLE